MLDLKKIKIRNRFNSEEEYDTFLDWIQDFYIRTRKQYIFLGIREEKFDNLFYDNINEFCGVVQNPEFQISEATEKFMHDYIMKEYKKLKVRIFDNWLIFIERTVDGSAKILKSFVRELESHNLFITEEFFMMLMAQSKKFKYHMNLLGIGDFSFSEFNRYVHGEYDFYLSLKASKISLKEVINLFNYLVIIGGYSSDNVDDEYLKKIKFVIFNWNKINAIWNLYKEILGDILIEEFIKTIMLFSILELEDTIKAYDIYMNTTLKENKDTTFIIKILNSNISRQNKEIENAQEGKSQNVTLDSLRNLYNRFFKKYIHLEENAAIDKIRNWLLSLSDEQRKIIILYGNYQFTRVSTEGKMALNFINDYIYELKREIEKEKAKGKTNIKTLDEYFPLYFLNIQERKTIVDRLFHETDQEEQAMIMEYVNGISYDFTSISDLIERHNLYIGTIDDKYFISVLFRDNKESLELKKRIIDYLYSLLSDDEISILRGGKKNEAWRAIVQNLRIKYANIVKYGFPRERTLDTYFPLTYGMSEAKRNEIIDNFLGEYNSIIRNRNYLLRYVRGEIELSDTDEKIADENIKLLERRYSYYIKIKLDPFMRIKNMLENDFSIKIEQEFSYDKAELLGDQILILRQAFKEAKVKISEYERMFYETIKQIFMNDPLMDVLDVVRQAIEVMYEYLEKNYVPKV